ncbi:MAG: hypothetical protein ABIU09_02455 [Pyrinomonadaceae bacterium]
MSEKKVWFITGSSTGCGRELAEELQTGVDTAFDGMKAGAIGG